VHFTTSDPGSGKVLPPDYAFTVGDSGQHTFTNGFTLVTPGNQTITATDTSSRTGTTTVSVSNLPPSAPTDANSAANQIYKNAPTGALVGVTASSTPPAMGTVTYSLSNNAGGRFQIDSTTGVVSVANGAAIDFTSSGGSYTITVQANNGPASSSTNFAITVLDRWVVMDGAVPTFYWTAVAGAASYDVVLETSAGTQVMHGTSITATSWTGTGSLTNGQAYRWKLGTKPTFSTTQITYGPYQSFSYNALPTPTLGTPTGTIASDMPTFNWSAVSGALRYDLWVYDATTSAYTIQVSPSGTSYTVTAAQALTPGHTYRWWVRALDNSGNLTGWSAQGNFSVAALAAPTATAPGGTITTTTPTFTWTTVSGANHYDLWVDRYNASNSTWISQVVRLTNVGGGTSYTLTAAQALQPGANYRFWIGAVSTNGQGETWSNPSAGQLFTIAAPVATALNMTSTTQAGAATITTTTPTIMWNNIGAWAAYYDIWIDDLTTGTTQKIRMYVDGTMSSWKVGTAGSASNPPGAAARTPVATTLTSGHTYRYWVGAVNASGSEVWSTAYYFKVA
jgi:hypothetical protein